MNILYIANCWPAVFEAYILREIQWMRSRGHQIAVVSVAREETGRYVDLSQFEVDDVPVLQLELKQMSNDQIISETLSFARQHAIQLIDAHFARKPAEIAYQTHLGSGIPYSVRMRGGDVHSNTSPMLANIVQHASAVCPMSRFLADVLIGKRKLSRIPEGIPVDVSSSKLRIIPNSLPARYLAREPAGQSDDIQVIGSIGRVVPIKRFQDIIEAVAELAPDFPGLRLLIIGGGVEVPEIQELARRVGIGDRIEITGFISWEEVMALARRIHVYVQASELEGCSLAVIEAAFKGVPLVLSRTGHHEECVKPGINGYLFDAGDVAAIRQSLKSLLLAGAKQRQRMGAATLEIAGQRFVTENLMPRTESIFQAAMTGDRLPP